jgi:hypothetical protein
LITRSNERDQIVIFAQWTGGFRVRAFLVPVIKAISLEDKRVLFIVTGVLLNDCEPLTQFKMPSVPVQENAVFVLCIESNVIRELLLIESIRAFAGKLRDLEIFAVAPRPQNAGLRAALSERESTCDRLVGQLRAELSERFTAREELNGSIRSREVSVGVTGPIRWLHKQVQFRPGKNGERWPTFGRGRRRLKLEDYFREMIATR